MYVKRTLNALKYNDCGIRIIHGKKVRRKTTKYFYHLIILNVCISIFRFGIPILVIREHSTFSKSNPGANTRMTMK